MSPVRQILLIAFALFLAPLAGHASESVPVVSARATVSLVSEADSYQPGQNIRLGLRFRMTPGWHIYWQNPGDAGSPPEIVWKLPPGARAAAIQWPAPVRVTEGPVVNYAYTGEIVLPVVITPAPGDRPLTVQADANWLVCANICVPEEGHFRLTLPAGPATPSSIAPLFAAADARLPQPSPFVAQLAPDGRLTVTGEGLSPARVADAWFFPAVWGPIDQNTRQGLERHANGVTLRLRPGPQFRPDLPLKGVLVLRDPRGNESYLDITTTIAKPIGTLNGNDIGRVLLLALAGGLILNLMPCVFPVLAMKALAIARLSGQERRQVRGQALSYTGGVLLAFLALGAALGGLRAMGTAAGWGFQYQSPAFVAAMAWLLFGIGLNLSGIFEIGGRLAGSGQQLAGQRGHVGSFFTGVLAAVVATPCTAPFMATAVAAAITAPPVAALVIWAALGLGLALPYLVLAAVPQLARLLPRPGAWMDVVRQLLAFPMYAAAIWLLWVASQQTGPTGVLVVAGGMCLLALGAWALGHAQRATGRGRHVGRGVALLTGLAAVSVLVLLGPGSTSGSAPAPATDGSEPFSNARLAALRAQGRPVFVDMTAAWCVTCLVNERVALSPLAVREAFAANHVAYLKGDWTRQDPEITAFLRAAGRDGVPLYVYYPPDGGPVVLPQILTPAVVLSELHSHQT
jgi:thiol:disulfide interchange protein/DsbC/DsbD-like thiol-disulfide interchange protein